MRLVTVQDSNGRSIAINPNFIETITETANKDLGAICEVTMASGKKHALAVPIEQAIKKLKVGA